MNTIDVTGCKDVAARILRYQVNWLKAVGGRDAGFPIIQRGMLLGYVSSSELECFGYGLDMC
jgi:hypothetical protein